MGSLFYQYGCRQVAFSSFILTLCILFLALSRVAMLGRLIGTLCILLTAVLAISEGPASGYVDIFGVMRSSINLTTSIHPLHVKDVKWTHIMEGKEHLVAKIQHGYLVDNQNTRYKQFYSGTVLGIGDLTIGDCGLYTADVTFQNNTMKEEKFNVTVLGEVMNNHSAVNKITPPVIVVVAMAVTVSVEWLKYRNSLSNLPGNAPQSEVGSSSWNT
ncbi:uncharacterized protein [Phyllobates terribilis]|uniref:uncharacterized protein n=1 Tax=Phyllobates terribilis TaxID=111132 RepID=UPI003CCAC28F